MDEKYVRPEIRPTGLKAFESVGWRESSKHDGGGSKQTILLYEDTFVFIEFGGSTWAYEFVLLLLLEFNRIYH